MHDDVVDGSIDGGDGHPAGQSRGPRRERGVKGENRAGITDEFKSLT